MRLKRNFYQRDVLQVAPDLLGKLLVRKFSNGKVEKYIITEVEAYRGQEDKASHARFGKTERNKIMFDKGGLVYVYLAYGMYWMLNIVTGEKEKPQAVLIRGTRGIDGPGRLGKQLKLDKSFYGEDLTKSKRIWIEDRKKKTNIEIKRTERIGVSYAGKWAGRKWRFEKV